MRAHEYLYSAVRTKKDDLAAPSVWIKETNTERLRALPVLSVVRWERTTSAHAASHRQNPRLPKQLKNELQKIQEETVLKPLPSTHLESGGSGGRLEQNRCRPTAVFR